MAWICKDKDGDCWIHESRPEKTSCQFISDDGKAYRITGSMYIIGRELTWSDEPVEIGEIKPEQPGLKAVEVNERAEFWKACITAALSSSRLHYIGIIEDADNLLIEYDKRFGSKTNEETVVIERVQ